MSKASLHASPASSSACDDENALAARELLDDGEIPADFEVDEVIGINSTNLRTINNIEVVGAYNSTF